MSTPLPNHQPERIRAKYTLSTATTASLMVCCFCFWVVFADCLSVDPQNFTSRVLHVHLRYVASDYCWCLGLFIKLMYTSKSPGSIYWLKYFPRFSKQHSTGFAFTNTDTDDVTRCCPLTVIVSEIVGVWKIFIAVVQHERHSPAYLDICRWKIVLLIRNVTVRVALNELKFKCWWPVAPDRFSKCMQLCLVTSSIGYCDVAMTDCVDAVSIHALWSQWRCFRCSFGMAQHPGFVGVNFLVFVIPTGYQKSPYQASIVVPDFLIAWSIFLITVYLVNDLFTDDNDLR